MTTAELIGALLKRGYAPSPVGCVAVLRGNATSWAATNPDPALPIPEMGERYFFWPDHPADDDSAAWSEGARLARDGNAP